MNPYIRWFVKQSLLPPVLMIWMVMLGLIFKTTLFWLPWLALFMLYLLSTSPVATLLVKSLEWHEVFDKKACQSADAIVILGGGYPRSTPEYEGYQPTAMSLERIRYGAKVYRECGVPILVSGGGDRSEAKTMAGTLSNDYGIETRWLEENSLTTWQNAQYSYRLLSKELGTDHPHIILVTHSWHMPRSVMSFQKMGFDITAAPTRFTWEKVPWGRLRYWVPQARSLKDSEMALHEYLGLVWYWLSDRLEVGN